jgi:formiminoglutamase
MSGASSSAAAWSTRLEPALHLRDHPPRRDDPRLEDVIEMWSGDAAALKPGRAVLLGFPQDHGIRRNHGRRGAAAAPQEIRRHLYRLTPWDGENDIELSAVPPLDLGNVHVAGTLEETQAVLGEVIAAVLERGAVPIVLGGGHETAFGHYLGYVAAARKVGIINIDAHLDVGPCHGDHGHCGSPFRQALEHPGRPLPRTHYACLGVQPHSVSRAHWLYAREHGCVVRWADEVRDHLAEQFGKERDRFAAAGSSVYLSIDADVVRAADVPGVSAPNALGLSGAEVAALARRAGQSPAVASLDVVEVNPRHDRDGQSARWAALVVWNFLAGLAQRTDNPAGVTVRS